MDVIDRRYAAVVKTYVAAVAITFTKDAL